MFQAFSGPLRYSCILFTLLFVIALFTGSYTFPLLSRFHNDTRSTLKNALALSIGYFPRSVLVAIINAFPFYLVLNNLYLFLQTGFIWISVYFSAGAYINSLLLKKIFARYDPSEEPSET